MPNIKEVFARNIEDNIAPVIYFHTIDPETASREVGEYVFTSRERDSTRRIGGIHEQMEDLLNNLYMALKDGAKLPASWISGFFGSGKSSFAKLLGLALDGMVIPKTDAKGNVIGEWTMEEALVARDDTKNGDQLAAAFARLKSTVDPMAVIFDIGTMAKNNEVIPHTAYRQILVKLGYSSLDGVAHFELALEDEGRYDEFVERYRARYNAGWETKKNGGLAAPQFRAIYKELFPSLGELLEIATFKASSLDVKTMVDNILRALDRRAPGKTVFIVVDEVSQYITSQDNQSKVNLQSFISELGSRSKPGVCRLWFLATGQEKLEEQSKDSVLFKLMDRFPQALRVHLDRANVSEVVERRLLKKKPGSALESYLTDAHLDLLKLHAYGCKDITREKLIEDYPLLSEHIPLFMDITQSLRNTSARTQSDSGGVRSVLNNIWSLFNEQPVALKDKPLGTLLTLDMLFDMIGSSVDSDVLLTLHRLFERTDGNSMERKAAKAIALLEMNGDAQPVTKELLSSLLYPELGAQGVDAQVEKALDALRKDNWIQYGEKSGWSIQNNAAQEWNRQKAAFSVSAGERDEILRKLTAEIVEPVAQPVFPRLGVRFPLACFWDTDLPEDRLTGRGEATSVDVCFHWVPNQGRREKAEEWLDLSRDKKKMIHLVSGETSVMESLVNDWKKAQKIIARYRGQSGLTPVQSRLLIIEQGAAETAYEALRKELRTAWLEGSFYFDGRREAATGSGSTFDAALKGGAEGIIARLYHQFESGNVHITINDFNQLFDKDTGGLSSVFLLGPGGLGIARSDSGKIVFSPEGAVPTAILAHIRERSFVTGEELFKLFASPPYGWSRQVIKSSVIALLRDEKVKIGAITAIRDPDARKLFEGDREFARAEIETRHVDGDSISARDRNAMCQFFEKTLKASNVDNNSDSLADLVFEKFPKIKDQIAVIERSLSSLKIPLQAPIADLNAALTECLSNRLAEVALYRLKANLAVLEAGYPRLVQTSEALGEATVKELKSLRSALEVEAAQLGEIEEDDAIVSDIQILKDQFAQTEPWKGYADSLPASDAIRATYKARRELYARIERILYDETVSRLKARPDFAHLDTDAQDGVLSLVSSVFQDIDTDATQPSLVSLSRLESLIREAEDRAQRLIDQEINRAVTGERVQMVKTGLRNKMVSNEAELESALGTLRERCLTVLASGDKVRFEE